MYKFLSKTPTHTKNVHLCTTKSTTHLLITLSKTYANTTTFVQRTGHNNTQMNYAHTEANLKSVKDIK